MSDQPTRHFSPSTISLDTWAVLLALLAALLVRFGIIKTVPW